MTTREITSQQLLFFFCVCLLVLAAGFGLRDPWPADEPRFALAAKQMVESGNWWFTQRGNELYSDKPPMFIWMQALLLRITHTPRLSFLLPSLLAALLTLYCVFDLTRRLHSTRHAVVAVATLLITAQFTYQMKRAQIDPVLLGFTTFSAYAFLRYLLLQGKPHWLYVGWFFAGLGIMTKGVGFLPLLLFPALWVLRKCQFQIAPHHVAGKGSIKRALLCWLCLLLPIFLWLTPVLVQAYSSNGDPLKQAYVQDLLLRQTASRLVNAWHHQKPFYYFAEVIAVAWLPFSLALFWLVPAWRDAYKQRDATVWLPLTAAVLVLLFFSLSTGKRDMYILPALPLFVLAAAPYLPSILSKPRAHRLILWFALLLSASMIVASLLAITGEPSFESRLMTERGLESDAIWYALFAIGGVAFALTVLLRRRAGLSVFAALCCIWVGLGLLVMPMLNDVSSARALMHRVVQQTGAHASWAMLGWREQHLLQAQGEPPVLFGFKRNAREQTLEAMRWLQASPSRWLFADRSWLKHCPNRDFIAPVFAVGSRREWVLLQTSESVRQCVETSTASTSK